MSSCLTRPATLRDAKSVAEIHLGAAHPPGTAASAVLTPRALGFDRQQVFWREAIEYGEPQIYVACDADTVVGFVGFDRCRDKGSPPSMGEIWSIYVLPAYWDRGFGLALWDAARDGLLEEGCTDVSVWLPLGNERVMRFHQLAGFKREMASARTVPVDSVRVEEIRLKRKL